MQTGPPPTYDRFVAWQRAVRTIVLALLACAACSSPGSPRLTTLVFAGPGVEPDTLNPLLTREADVADFALLYMPVLLEDNNRGRLVPEIALAVPTRRNGGISAGGRTITYHLRHRVVWQDGAPLTAADVVFTFHAVMNPSNNLGSRMGYDEIASVDSKGPWTVAVHMKRPYSPIVAEFGTYEGYPVLPAHILSRYRSINFVPFNSLPVGAGPYYVVKWARGDHITLEANPRYWRGKPHIERLIFRFIPNANTAAAQLQTGELGAWFNADPNAYPELRDTPVRLVTSPMNDIHLLLLNLRDPILRDVRVRRALASALNRKLIVRAAVHGFGIRVNSDQPTFSWAYDSPRDAPHYDPQQAAALLDAAGWKRGAGGIRYHDGRPLQLQLSGTPDITAWPTLSTLIQEELRRVGVLPSIKTYPTSLYFGAAANGGILRSGKFQIAYDGHLLGSDPNNEQYYGCGEFAPDGANVTYWCNHAADAALSDAVVTYDRARRKRDYAIVQDQMAHDVPIIPLWEVKRIDAFHTPLVKFSPSPAGPTFWNAWAWRLPNG